MHRLAARLIELRRLAGNTRQVSPSEEWNNSLASSPPFRYDRNVPARPTDGSPPLIVDFTPHRVSYAGDPGGWWFASALHEPRVVALNNAGQVVERFECPFVDRVISVGDAVLGLAWEHAWGRRWGHTRLGERQGASGYDLRSGRRLWHLEGGVSGLVGASLAVGRATPRWDAPHHLFDLRTGEPRWSFTAAEPVVAADAELLYVLAHEGSIAAYEIATGKQRWCFEPPDHRRVKGLCRALAVTARGIWYVSHPQEERAVLTCLSRTDGEPVNEREFRGWVNHLLGVGDALVLHHEFGLAVVDGSRDDEVVALTSDHPDAMVRADGVGAALLADTALVVMSSASTSPNRFTLADSWNAFHLDNGIVTLGDGSRLLRWPLSYTASKPTVQATVVAAGQHDAPLEAASIVFSGPALVLVEHPSRGRFTLKVANTGLKKGDSVAIGGFVPGPMSSTIATEFSYTSGGQTKQVQIGTGPAKPGSVVEVARTTKARRKGVSPSVRRLIKTLTTHRLLETMTEAEITKLALRIFPSGTIDETATATLLQHVHDDPARGLAFGFLSHDWRFGQETQDVIAEFAACLKGEPIRFEQIETKPDALRVRSSTIDSRDDDWIDLAGQGLEAVAHFLNQKLEIARASRRVFSLETGGDWHAFLIRTGDEIAAMRAAGVPGLR